MDKLRTKVQNADWWEITYLIIYGAIFTYEFLGTTMFEIKWPPRFGYIFLAASALYTIAKFIWHNTYTKKEMILSAIILFAFIMPAILTDYSFLWYVGFLIVGAKDVDFDKILKVYLTIGITIMLAAFAASQMGWIENLAFTALRNNEVKYRYSFGCIYPTDFSAHIFYLAVAGLCLCENRITLGKIINLIILAFFVQDKCGARTSFICLFVFAFSVLFVRVFKQYIKRNWLYYVINCATIGFSLLYFGLTYAFDEQDVKMLQLDSLLSGRLALGKKAVYNFGFKLFGQNIVERGWGRGTVEGEYFFLDDSYIRIAVLYGIILLLLVLGMLFVDGIRTIKTKRIIILVALAVVGLHSFMEHHLLEIAYNPLLLLIFADLTNREKKRVGESDERFKESTIKIC